MMATNILELTTATLHPDSDIENHTLWLSPFGGVTHLDGPLFVGTTNGSGASVVEVARRNPLNSALDPMTLSPRDAADLQEFLAHPTAFPRVPIRRLPERSQNQRQS